MRSPVTLDGVKTLQRALKALGEANSDRYYLLLRQDRVLCALPQDRLSAVRTIELYQPQRWQGRLIKQFIKLCLRTGIPCPFLRTWHSGDTNTRYVTQIGMMIGSSGHLCERAVAVAKREEDWRIVKLAFGPIGEEILTHEVEMLNALKDRSNIPRVRDFSSSPEQTQLHMDWQSGSSWSDASTQPIIDLLKSWSSSSRPQPMADFPEWKLISETISRYPFWNSKLEQWTKWKLTPSIRHGDLTRPNLRHGEDNITLVHDWERGALDGMPGLDLAHYLIQDSKFSRSNSNDEIIRIVVHELRKEPNLSFLREIGWYDHPIDLLACTIAFNVANGYFQDDLLLTALERYARSITGPTDAVIENGINRTTRFSIITPSHNQGRYLRDCLNSVIAQQAPGLEIEHIVIDAVSTDGTQEILKEYPNIKWVSEPDEGISDAINKGFKMATGDWLMWLNCDDYLLPNALKNVADHIASHPSASVVYGDCQFINADKSLIRRKFDHPMDEWTLLFAGCYIASTSCFLKREIIDHEILLDSDYKVCMDWDLYLRLIRENYVFSYLPKALASFRWHETNTSLTLSKKAMEESIQLQKKHIQLRDLPEWLGTKPAVIMMRTAMRFVRSYKRYLAHGRIR